MTASIIDGKAIATEVRTEVAQGVEKLLADGGPRPGLATVLVGDNPASHTYVKAKRKACAEAGIESYGNELPATATQAEVEALVVRLNQDPKVHGILVQLPLPAGLDEEAVLKAISLEKDVTVSIRSTSDAWLRRGGSRCSSHALRPDAWCC
jgi:5,10-methylene-tetrahydrofolate dehydrogenase/methenyl tetrahydrofolate cyclohydrolase